MTELEYKKSIFDILSDLKGLNPLKELFWGELNYERVNESLSRQGWSKIASEALAEDPVLFATGGEDGGFHVLYSRLASDRLLLGHERPVVSRLLKEHPYSLFVFSNEQQDQWHFLNVKYDEKGDKRRLFRRITIGPQERLRTATERLTLLDIEGIEKTLFGLSPLAIQQAHDEAFDVEAVGDDFFKQYAKIFGNVEKSIEGIHEPNQKRLFTQKLFNRLLFIPFIEKKGWLSLNGQKDYLFSLWKNYIKNSSMKSNFYRDRLIILFFCGLNTSKKDFMDEANIINNIGNVPYLNGGLFEREDEDYNENILIPDSCFNSIINDLFYRFNFTVTESTPLDIEVAVDPEMLGRVFEELVTGRHETGSYYTPKPVVSFMCKESLKGYLKTLLHDESILAIENFVEYHNAEELQNPEAVLDAIRNVKVCDPACGSGAYLLGILHELIEMRNCLFKSKNIDPLSDYERKLEIIQKNVWGVDIDPFAVNIARLRLWLSLIVEFEGTNPPPLPNLDFKIEYGDSLTAPNPEGTDQIGFRDNQLNEYENAKAKFMTAHGLYKKELMEKVLGLKKQIAIWSDNKIPSSGFDWIVEFAEIFFEKGFDIVLSNPPYVRTDAPFSHIENEEERQVAIDSWQEYRNLLRKSCIYQTLYEKWDLYIAFIERAFQLLSSNGQMIFIISDSYNTSKFTLKSHEFFLENSTIERIDFCSDISLFRAGVNNTILHLKKTFPDEKHKPIRAYRWGNRSDQFNDNIKLLYSEPQLSFGKDFFRPESKKSTIRNQNFIPFGNICYVSWGLRPCSNERTHRGLFKKKDLVSSVKDNKHSKRFVEGKDTTKWWIFRNSYLEWNTERSPILLARPTFPELYTVEEKLFAMQISGSEQRVAYDNQQRLCNHSMACCVPWYMLKGVVNRSISKTAKYKLQDVTGDREKREKISKQFILKYVLAILNSTVTGEFLNKCRRNKMQLYPDDWKQVPIAPIPMKEQLEFAKLVDIIFREFEQNSYPLSEQALMKVQKIESELDKKIKKIYSEK